MRRQRLVAARDRDAALAAARQAEAQIAVAGGNSRQSTAEARARILADLAKAESEARLRQEELTKTVKRSSLQSLVSPVTCTVTHFAITTVGCVAADAKPQMVTVHARREQHTEAA